MISPSPQELAQEAREALDQSWPNRTPEERFQRLVRLGWINARGQVTRLLGGEAEPEPGQPSLEEGAADGAANGDRNGR
jgi:hypothetical protein